MSTLSELPGSIKRKKFARGLRRVGFVENKKGGKGNHSKFIWKNNKHVTVPERIDKDVLYYILKEVEEISGVTWDEIKKYF
jgi:predicted RNA binding protein YcfA (HicA-like mRNA interferase family)